MLELRDSGNVVEFCTIVVLFLFSYTFSATVILHSGARICIGGPLVIR